MPLLNRIIMTIADLRRRLSYKLTLWVWLIIIATTLSIVVLTIPFLQEVVLNRMNNEAEDIASSILHANSTSLIAEEYGLVVDHCINIVNESKSILYLKIVKKNGYILLFSRDKWEQQFDGSIKFDNRLSKGIIDYSKLINQEVYKKNVPFIYSGLNWGWIEIGLSLDYYNESRDRIVYRFTWLTLLLAVIGFFSSIYFAKKITGPIISLDKITKELAEGNLNAKTNIKTGDELESLASSFDKMTDSLRTAKEHLEDKVQERTLQLEQINKMLLDEIAERKKAEVSLNNSLKEKDILLKEIHHRVKNNLQIITSLLNLQARQITDEENLAIFRDSQNRIKSMALVHEKLYQSQDFVQIDLKEYIINLSSFIHETYSNNQTVVKTKYDLENLDLSIDKIVSLGLILSELISNAYKYAFNNLPKEKENYITIRSFKNFQNRQMISVEDNGIGLPDNFEIENTQSLGLKLVHNLCNQIEAELLVEINNGTKFTILFN